MKRYLKFLILFLIISLLLVIILCFAGCSSLPDITNSSGYRIQVVRDNDNYIVYCDDEHAYSVNLIGDNIYLLALGEIIFEENDVFFTK